ncbi:MAG TPA: helix-turn-helix domain-containing protein [bacterium]|jgi:putative transcriptional regulator|nr:helix-turn-helix domain-containing protein [bacterium]
MKNNDFNDLLKSVQQMGEIMKGKKLVGTKVTYRATPATAKEVQKIRKELHLTQEVFARVVGESPSAIRHWEQGIRTPRGSAAKLIRVLKAHPKLVAELL